MLESCEWIYTQAAEDDLADVITGLIRDIRHVLVHPDLRLDQKLLAVSALADAAEPDFPAGRPGNGRADGTAGSPCDTPVRPAVAAF